MLHSCIFVEAFKLALKLGTTGIQKKKKDPLTAYFQANISLDLLQR
jgi:hypothetical protein